MIQTQTVNTPQAENSPRTNKGKNGQQQRPRLSMEEIQKIKIAKAQEYGSRVISRPTTPETQALVSLTEQINDLHAQFKIQSSSAFSSIKGNRAAKIESQFVETLLHLARLGELMQRELSALPGNRNVRFIVPPSMRKAFQAYKTQIQQQEGNNNSGPAKAKATGNAPEDNGSKSAPVVAKAVKAQKTAPAATVEEAPVAAAG